MRSGISLTHKFAEDAGYVWSTAIVRIQGQKHVAIVVDYKIVNSSIISVI